MPRPGIFLGMRGSSGHTTTAIHDIEYVSPIEYTSLSLGKAPLPIPAIPVSRTPPPPPPPFRLFLSFHCRSCLSYSAPAPPPPKHTQSAFYSDQCLAALGVGSKVGHGLPSGLEFDRLTRGMARVLIGKVAEGRAAAKRGFLRCVPCALSLCPGSCVSCQGWERLWGVTRRGGRTWARA